VDVLGQTSGLKAAQLNALERVYRRRIDPSEVVSAELARFICGLSHELRRQIGILVDRTGSVKYVMVGDDREIMLPDLTDYALGRSGLRGLRCIHTHLKNEGLSQDDLTDLALLRLDMMVAIGVNGSGFPASVYYAHILPENPTNQQVEQLFAPSLGALDLNLKQFLQGLDHELERGLEIGNIDLSDPRERAILVSVSQARRREIDEGKIKEVVIRALQQRATMLVFDQDLSPTQVRSIAALTDLKVVDRSQIILDIFARRAHTLDGKVQVELAQLKYILPRLSGKGTELSRLMGGIGGRGPGETKLEIDRRRIRERITRLEKRLKQMSRGRLQRRSRRIRAEVPIISIVGYTNAGKSTLLNSLTRSEVFTEDLLFATLDTSTRRLRFPLDREVIITDTVGFIRKLPPSLMGAFKSTLEELSDADLLLHVVDLSNPRFEEQIQAVEQILADLDLGHIPHLLVFNKIDLVDPEECQALCRRFKAVAVCAQDRRSFEMLLDQLQQRFWHGDDEIESMPDDGGGVDS